MRISDWISDVCSSDLRSEQFTGHFAGHGIHATETRVWIASHHRLLQRRCSPVRSTFAAFWQRCADCHFVRAAKLLDRDVAKTKRINSLTYVIQIRGIAESHANHLPADEIYAQVQTSDRHKHDRCYDRQKSDRHGYVPPFQEIDIRIFRDEFQMVYKFYP